MGAMSNVDVIMQDSTTPMQAIMTISDTYGITPAEALTVVRPNMNPVQRYNVRQSMPKMMARHYSQQSQETPSLPPRPDVDSMAEPKMGEFWGNR